MQLHDIKSTAKNKKHKRVGRGGKRGTYSGRGSKGQKSRAGARIRPGFRGGDNPIWKIFPKQRGATGKVDIKKAKFRLTRDKPAILQLSDLEASFNNEEVVSVGSLFKKGLISSGKNGVKILGQGEISKKLTFLGISFSKSAEEKIKKTGGAIK